MSKQLSAELKKKIIDKANDYEWEDNPEAVRSAYIDGATDYAELFVEAQERIKNLEQLFKDLHSYCNQQGIYAAPIQDIIGKALSPDNKLKEDE